MRWFYLLSVLIASSCSTRSTVSIKSFPEGAEVAYVGKNGEVKSVGKTPLNVPSEFLNDGRISSFVVSKDGYKDHQVILGRDRSEENYDITLNLQTMGEHPKNLDARARQEKLAKLLLQAHNLTISKRYDEAERVLGNVIQDYPLISAGYDLLGNVSYLQKDLKRALKNYEKSLQLNPENAETKMMIEKLKGMVQ
jgi:tetratricopeptide (TPR) repeat protein